MGFFTAQSKGGPQQTGIATAWLRPYGSRPAGAVVPLF